MKNPITIWLKWLITSTILKLKNKNLHIGYLSKAHNVRFGNYNTIYDKVVVRNCSFGDYVYVANSSRIRNINTGKFCSIGANVKIGLGIHPTDYFTTFPAFYSINGDITFVEENLFEETGSNSIGNDVWIGDNAIILSNITIGNGAIVAAGAVVTKNVAPYSIVGGVPAKHIRYRFSEKVIQSLEDSKWWDHDISWILKNMPQKFK